MYVHIPQSRDHVAAPDINGAACVPVTGDRRIASNRDDRAVARSDSLVIPRLRMFHVDHGGMAEEQIR